MRRGVLIFLIVNLAVLIFLVHSVWTLLELLVINGIENAITKEELPKVGAKLDGSRKQLIPKIIHQTYINTSIPEVWKEAQQSCLDLHKKPDWEYKLWTDEDAEEFIAAKYPEFLDTFLSYPYPIQRADAIRYFVLNHYGGVYIDLDDGCNRSLEPLLMYPAFVRKTVPTGISNDVMGAVPHHPFFQRVIEELENYDRSWMLPYITVMASTGPLFLSIIWRHYGDEGLDAGDGADGGRIRILFPKEYNSYEWSFFTHHLGNSWHGYDVQLIFWVSDLSSSVNHPDVLTDVSQMARNWVLLTVVGFFVGGSLLVLGWFTYQRYFLKPKHHDGAHQVPRWKTQSIRDRLPFWSRRNQQEYELINRHEP